MERIAHYRIVRKLGEGGLGIVYAALDERLDRHVAIKLIKTDVLDEAARQAFWREARMAAAIDHPKLCRVYDVGEDAGQLYLAMELLEGEMLSDRIRRGPMALAQAIPIALEMLETLDALHRRSLVHRDLKPSNMMLTLHGLKLLDFGLARRFESADDATLTAVTNPSAIAGTPAYMAPEAIDGQAVDHRADLFAAGAIVYEMLAGRRAFQGGSMLAVLNAVLHSEPPALPEPFRRTEAAIRRALAKRAEDRFASASEFAAALQSPGEPAPPLEPSVRRLMVLPFKMLRQDEETGFLAASLPDAIATALSGIGSLQVRSSAAAARFAAEVPDLERIANDAGVDIVLTGTLLRAGSQLRAATQLLEVPGGSLLAAHSAQGSTEDVFHLQDDLVRRIVDALHLSLTAGEDRALRQSAPEAAGAYELYLRANVVGQGFKNVSGARDLYLACLELDENYAPAWARLGRCYRLLAKYQGDPAANVPLAERAFERALQLQPDLDLAHSLYAQLEADLGRPIQAMTRLLELFARHPQSAELAAGLVYACRLCGLLDESRAFHREVRRLDPLLPTSIVHTLFQSCDFRGSLEVNTADLGYIDAAAFAVLGDQEEALRRTTPNRFAGFPPLPHAYASSLHHLLRGGIDECLAIMDRAFDTFLLGPEEALYMTRQYAKCGAVAKALDRLDVIAGQGWANAEWLSRDPWFASLHSEPRFVELIGRIRANRRAALTVYRPISTQ